MLTAPTLSEVQTPNLTATLGGFPLHVVVDPIVLIVLLALVGIFVAVLSVVLIYHWRRFPFEHDVFRWTERTYLLGVVLLLGVAVVGIFIS